MNKYAGYEKKIKFKLFEYIYIYIYNTIRKIGIVYINLYKLWKIGGEAKGKINRWRH